MMLEGHAVSADNMDAIFIKESELVVVLWAEDVTYSCKLRVGFQFLQSDNAMATSRLLACVKVSCVFAHVLFTVQATGNCRMFVVITGLTQLEVAIFFLR